jgi:FkbM family methyltransferase
VVGDLVDSEMPVVFDVGANEGQFTDMIDAELPDASVHLFEPQATLLPTLEEKYGNDPHRTVNGYALADDDAETTLHYDERGSSLASMSERDLDHVDITFDKTEAVQTRTLDGYCDEHDIDWIDYLKIDVEGHELDVLDGAAGMIEAGAIGYITFEFGGSNVDTRTFFRDYYTFFEERGYDVYRILPGADLYELRQYR